MFTLLMLISHSISDFIIQSNNTVILKHRMDWKGYLYHGIGLLVSSLCMILLVELHDMPKLVSRILLIVLIHLLIDFIKEIILNYFSKFSNKEIIKKADIVVFLFDQMLHIILILLLTNDITLRFNKLNEFLLSIMSSQDGFNQLDLKLIFMIMYISFSGAYLIPIVFNLVYANVDNYTNILNDKFKKDIGINEHVEHKFIDEVKTGKWIGILERILITIFLYNNEIEAIGFIIAVKSLARFKMLDSKIFSEYYLLGTLFSVVYNLSAYGILIRIL